MSRVRVIGHGTLVDEAVALLQKSGVMEPVTTSLDGIVLEPLSVDPALRESLQDRIDRARFSVSFLARYRRYEAPFSLFVGEKIHVDRDGFDELLGGDDAYAHCLRMSDERSTCVREIARLAELERALEPWESLELPIADWRGTEHVALFAGTVPVTRSSAIRGTLREAVVEASVDEVSRGDVREAWIVLAPRELEQSVRDVLGCTEFEESAFPDLFGPPLEELSLAREARAALEERREAIDVEAAAVAATEYSVEFARLRRLEAAAAALEASGRFATTTSTFVAEGWVPDRDRGRLTQALAPLGEAVDVEFRPPKPDDDVPVMLENPAVVRPFEVITDLYGRPAYGGFDPTPVLAPFFFLFFGMCLGDVAYGAMLAGAAWLIKRRLDVAPGVRRFMDLLIAGGLASIAWGFVTRGFFALPAESLPQPLRYRPLIDPQTELLTLLGLCIVIGVVHVSLAVGIALVARWRAGERLDAVTDQGSTLVFIASMVAVVAGAAGVLPESVTMPALWFGLGQAVILKGGFVQALLGRVSRRRLITAPFAGLWGLYGMVGYGSDVLSYTRLAALGLAGMYVGDAMNRLSGLSSEIPAVGPVVGVVVFVVGHVFNVGINVLGAFVHPTRLQFVEFFGKFHEGGGRPFAPLAQGGPGLVIEDTYPSGRKDKVRA